MIQENSILNNTYRIVRLLGKGGTGVIYLAEHLHLRKAVVLKQIKTTLQDSVAVRQEADILKSLHHMYLPQVYDFFVYEGMVFTVIDYISGYDLQHYIESGMLLSEEQLVTWMMQLCDALEYLHSHNPPVFHNDIKPANIIITDEGNVCLIDFNISTDAADMIYGFTPEYASPEQYYKVLSLTNPAYAGYSPLVGAQSDLYSLGATFYRLASRQPLSVYAVVDNTQPSFSFLGTGYSEGFAAVIDRLMKTAPEQRYNSAKELGKALRLLTRDEVRYRKYWTMRVATLLLAGVMVVGGVWMIYRGNSEIRIEQFDSAYDAVCASYETEDYQETIRQGPAVLSNREWSKLLTDDKEAKLDYIIGMSYYNLGSFEGAEKYLDSAVKKEKDASERCGYEMDLAIDLAYMGRLGDAAQMLDKAMADGLDTARVCYVSAQISYAGGSFDNVIAYYGQAESAAINDELEALFSELVGDAYIAKGDNASAVAMYERAYSLHGGVTQTRKLADAYVGQASVQGLSTGDKTEWLEKALSMYKILTEKEYHSAIDLINYGKLFRIVASARGDYEPYYTSSVEVLNAAAAEYPDDYRVYMQLAFTYDKMGQSKAAVQACRTADQLGGAELQGADDDDAVLFRELKGKLGI